MDENNFLEESLSALVLSRLPGLTQSQALEAMRHYGSAAAALHDKGKESRGWAKVMANEENFRHSLAWAGKEMDFCMSNSVRVIPISSPDYPHLLADCPDAPAVIFYKGSAKTERLESISIVGTRRITDYGKRMVEELVEGLAEFCPNLLIVSGLAYGVDIFSHRAALKHGLDTIGVLAHGLDRIYPSMHERTAGEMVRQGGLLTEYSTGTNPDRGNFVRRNRIIAGLSAATLVVESAEKGGALITARLAASYNREVMAVPGRATDEFSKGCNNLIYRNEAHLVASAEDVAKLMNWDCPKVHKAEPSLFKEELLSNEERQIVSALRGCEGLTQNQICEKTGLAAAKVMSALFDLEMEGLTVKLSGNKYALK